MANDCNLNVTCTVQVTMYQKGCLVIYNPVSTNIILRCFRSWSTFMPSTDINQKRSKNKVTPQQQELAAAILIHLQEYIFSSKDNYNF
jgi:hypothetical protein